MNKVILMGNITNDMELNNTPNGTAYVRFNIACNNGKDKNGNDRPADFIPCIAYGKNAMHITQYKKKGDPLMVEGRWHSFSYEKEEETRYGNECVVEKKWFIGSKKANDEPLEMEISEEEALSDFYSEINQNLTF